MNIQEKDKRYCWHPMTQHKTERTPPVITSAKGAVLVDSDGNEILDMISSWWTSIHGHSNDELNQALIEQVEQVEHVMFAGFSHPPAIHLSEMLAQNLPGDLNRVFYSDNGSSAIEISLKIAYQYWRNKGEDKRTKFLAFDGAYHGDTVGAMSLGKGCGFFKLFEGLTFDITTLPYADTWQGDATIEEREAKALAEIEEIINKTKHEVAALIVEPLVQGAGGLRMSRPEFMKQVTEMAQKNDILVIYDEVAVGFGRTGELFACQKIDVTPDLICLSKGLSAGYLPMAVTVATDRIYDVFLSDDVEKGFLHSHTFSANPLACAVALKSLKMFIDNDVLQDVKNIEQKHLAFIDVIKGMPNVHKARVMGPILAFNLTEERNGYKNTMSEELRRWFFDNGLNIRPIGSVVYLMPPYCITDEQLQRAYDGIVEGLNFISGRQDLAA